MRNLVFLLLLLNTGCSKVYEIADQLVDGIYFDQRIEQYCTDAIFETYSLFKVTKTEISSPNDLFTQSEAETLISHDIDRILSKITEGTFSLEEMNKFKKEVSFKLPFYHGCTELLESQKCDQKTTPELQFSCLGNSVRAFYLKKLITSSSFQRIDKREQKKIKEELRELKSSIRTN